MHTFNVFLGYNTPMPGWFYCPYLSSPPGHLRSRNYLVRYLVTQGARVHSCLLPSLICAFLVTSLHKISAVIHFRLFMLLLVQMLGKYALSSIFTIVQMLDKFCNRTLDLQIKLFEALIFNSNSAFKHPHTTV